MGANDSRTIDLVPVTTAWPAFDPQPYVALQAAWIKWAERLMEENRWPLSGNVDQWIRTWGEVVGQVGVFNVNVAGSGNPQLEKRIGSQFSYGRQLGRILDVLKPLVQANQDTLRATAGEKALREFLEMVDTIEAMKQRPVGDIVDEVSLWQKSADFDQKLRELIDRLQALGTA
jgi:hypothetical protein